MSLLPTIGAVDQDTGFYNGVATQSLRFNRADSPELSYTPSAGDRRTYTISVWVKLGTHFDQYRAIFGAGGGGNRDRLQVMNNQTLVLNLNDGTDASLTTNALLRDSSAWYHIVAILDSTNGTNASKIRLYVNGTEQTYSATTYPSQNYEGRINTNIEHFIGNSSADNLYFDGYLAEFNFIEGQSLKPEAFGETKNGVWIPKKYGTKPSLIAQDTGTAIGDMTDQGGLAGAFNGTHFQNYASSAAQASSQATSFIGKNWGSSKTVTGFILYSNTQYGFVGGGASTFTVKLYGKDGNPSNSTDGTLLFTSSAVTDANSRGAIRYFADTNINSEETISNFTTTTAFTYHWVVITPNASEGAFVSEIEFYEDGSTYYGANGFRMKFNASGLNTSSGAVSSPTNIGDDSSGNNNHLTPTNIVASDCNMPDSPENNFCTLNALDNDGNTRTGLGLSEGNLKGASTVNGWDNVRSTFTMPTGKWYVELLSTSGIGNGNSNIAIVPSEDAMDYGVALGSNFYGYTSTVWAYSSNGGLYNNYVGTSNPVTAGSNSTKWAADAIVALTFDGSTLKFYRNNSLIHTVGSIPSNDYAIGLGFYDTDESGIINFGQDPTFAGVQDSSTSAKTPSNSGAGTADSEGNGKFFYAPPSGFLALCSANLPEPTIGPNSDTQANDHFSSALFTGTSGDVDVAVPFKPDWVWIKARSDAQGHSLVDSSRGGTKLLQSNTDGLENSVNSGNDVNEIHFTVDGFTSNTDWHTNNYTYVSWNWKANGNTTSTIAVDSVSSGVPSIASTVQANTTAGFSIVTYSGNADASATIGHGLGKTPKLIFAKQRDEAGNWIGYNEVTGATNKLNLNQTTGSAESALWNDTAPTDKVFSVKDTSSEDTFGDGHTYVAYCFTDVEGYSKFGKYTGNGATSATNSDGTFAFLGFRPAFIMIKNTSASAEWVMIDSVRSTFNEVDKILSAEATSDEDDYVYANRNIDFLSNGFKIRNTQAGGSTALNTSNHIYFYMAFAEAPFKYANAR